MLHTLGAVHPRARDVSIVTNLPLSKSAALPDARPPPHLPVPCPPCLAPASRAPQTQRGGGVAEVVAALDGDVASVAAERC